MAMIDIKQVNFNVAIPPANNIIVCSNISTIFLFALLNFSHWQSYTAFWNTKQASITRCPLKQSIANQSKQIQKQKAFEEMCFLVFQGVLWLNQVREEGNPKLLLLWINLQFLETASWLTHVWWWLLLNVSLHIYLFINTFVFGSYSSRLATFMSDFTILIASGQIWRTSFNASSCASV